MTTPNIPLTEVPSGSLQPSAPVNASLQVIDALMLPNPIVQEIRSTTPTTTDADEGLRWIVGPGATGTFAGHEDEIAYCTAANLFFFYAPQENWQARNLDDGSQLEYTGSGGWQALPGGLGDAPSDGTIYGRQNATWVPAGGGGGGVTSLAPGHGVDIDATNPAIPIVIVDETELDSSLVPFAHSGFSAGNVEDAIVEASSMGGSGVSSVQAGHGVDVDATDPDNPIVAVDETELDSSVIPFSHSGFSASNIEDAIVEAYTSGSGGMASVVAGHGIDVNSADPDNPIVAVDETELDSGLVPFANSGFTATNVEDAIVEAASSGGSSGPSVSKIETGGSYILELGDAGMWIDRNNAGANTTTVPPNGTVAFPLDTEITIRQYGAGVTSLVAGVGVTLDKKANQSLAFATKGSVVSIKQTATNFWELVGDLQLGVSPDWSVTTLTGNSTRTETYGEVILLGNASGGAFTISLPTAVGNTAKYTIKKTDNSGNVVTVDADSTETIDGALTAPISGQYDSISLISNNANWFII